MTDTCGIYSDTQAEWRTPCFCKVPPFDYDGMASDSHPGDGISYSDLINSIISILAS